MTPLIIIGAGRSGTNALRDAVCSIPGFHTWPCDEINYIWRQGNRDHPTDQFVAAHAHDSARRAIRRAFERRQSVEPASVLVEKTCANSLRVEFVDQIFPDARMLHIVRDGRDVTASAMQRWRAPLDLRYLARKARFVPVPDLPYYAARYARSRVDKLRASDSRLSWWGPRFDGMERFDEATPLALIAASQWAACALTAQRQLAALDGDRTMTVRYEELVADPATALRRIVAWSGRSAGDDEIENAARSVESGSVGSWTRRLSDEDQRVIDPVITAAEEALEASW